MHRRLRADLAQTLALVASVLMLTMVLAGAPMYLNTIESLGLRSVLVSLSPSNRNLQVSTDNFPLTKGAMSEASRRVEIAVGELDDLAINVTQESHTRARYWALEPDAIIPGRASDSAVLQRFEGFPNYVQFVDGRAPLEATRLESGVVVAEVAVPFDRAELLGVNVGNEIWLASTPADPPYIKLEVVGRFTPNDLQEEFWFGLGFEAVEPPSPSLVARHPLPLFIADDGLFGLVTGGPSSIGTSRRLIQLDIDRVDELGPGAVERRLEEVARSLRSEFPESSLVSAIENRFKALREEIVFARIPTLIMGGVVLVAAGFLSITAAGSLMSRRRVETGRLRARGYSRRRIALVYLIETAPLVLVPVLVAPFVAHGVISAVGQLPEYEAIRFGLEMPVRIVWRAFAWSALGGVFVLGFMQWVAWSSNDREINSERLSSVRLERRPFFQRRYLDVVFLLFSGTVLWDLTTEGSVVLDKSGQPGELNQLLVFTPAIFLAGATLFFLRLLPEIARLASIGFGRRGPAWVHILSATFARFPVSYAWPIAILAMASGSVILSTTVAASLERGVTDQSGYEVGADLRALPVDFNSGTRTGILSDVRNVESVAGASIGLRAIGGLRDGGQGAPFEVLAIEPGEFARIGIFRDDYAAKPLGELLSELEPESGLEANLPPLRLLDNPTQVGVRMKSSTSQEFIRASLRLLDAAGRSWSVDLGDMSSTDWGVRMGEVPESAVQPLDVVGIVFFEQANDELGTPMTVYIDDLMSSNTVVDGDVSATQITVVESFENTDAWLPLASSKGIDTQASGFDYQRNSATDHGLQIDLGVGTNRGIRGLIRTTVESVPALFSQEALALNGLTVGDRTIVHVFNQSVPFRVAGEVEYFPTVDPGQGGFLVADATQLWSYLSMSSFNSAGFLAEMFIGLEDPNDEEVISNVSMTIGGIHNLIIRDEIRQSSLVTPLAIAGWRGASVVATSIAIVVGLIGYQAFSPVRPAVAKFNLAVLSALGIGRRSLVMVSVVEQIVVLGTGIAIGLGTGFLMARLAAGATTQTMTAGDPLPPILFSTDWAYLVGLVAALGVVAAVTTILDLIVIRRVNLAMTMKGG